TSSRARSEPGTRSTSISSGGRGSRARRCSSRQTAFTASWTSWGSPRSWHRASPRTPSGPSSTPRTRPARPTTSPRSWSGAFHPRRERGGRPRIPHASSRGHERIQLRRLGRHILPGGSPRERTPELLRDEASRGRAQQHLLPDAEARASRGLGGAGAGNVSVRAQGLAAHHAHQAAQGHVRGGALPHRVGPAPRGRLGPILFGLPPNLKKDVPRLVAFLALLPKDVKVAFEFRNPTWLDEEVFALLNSAGAALCIADDEKGTTPLTATAGWGYLRLRREDYTGTDLDAWATRVGEQAWEEAYVFFKHEEDAAAPELAG